MKIYPQWFYKNTKIEVPYGIGQRHFRIMKNDMWTKLFSVSNIQELQNRLVKLSPEAIFISVSTWHEPYYLGCKWRMRKAGYKVLHNTIMRSDLVIDFDDESGLDDMEESWSYLKESGFEKLKIVLTKRGFHIWVLDFYDKRCNNISPRPHEKELDICREKQFITEELEAQEIIFDKEVTIDTRRVVRLWGSLHEDGITICNAYDNLNDAVTAYIRRHKQGTEAERCMPLAGGMQMRRSLDEEEDVTKGISLWEEVLTRQLRRTASSSHKSGG